MIGRAITAQLIALLGTILSIIIGLGMWKNGHEVADALFTAASIWGGSLLVAFLVFASIFLSTLKGLKAFK